MGKKLSKKGVLVAAICWSVTTALWSVITALRLSGGYGDEGLSVLTALALIASAGACFANWYRYAAYEE